MAYEKEREFIQKLIELTKTDKIRWDQNLDIQLANYEGSKIFVWWPQDGKPELTFNDTRLEGYGLGIEELLGEIRKQYERQDRNGYGTTGRKEHQELERDRLTDEQKNAQGFTDAANKFLENEDKKNKKRQ